MAIAFDASSLGDAVATSLTISHTCTGSDRILFVAPHSNGSGDIITGVTYAGTAMTLINKQSCAANIWTYLFYLAAPATGANNIVISASGSGNLLGEGASYTGAKQTGIPDSSAGGTFAAATITQSTTTVADNCWLVGSIASNRDQTAGTNTTYRQNRSAFGLCDSNAAKTPAGSYSLQSTQADSAASCFQIASFAPVATVVAISQNPTLSLLGVGT